MAYIEVAFAGLMLICLDGQSHCPVGSYSKNTAWVVQADGRSMPCGRDSHEVTELALSFYSGDADYWPPAACKPKTSGPGVEPAVERKPDASDRSIDSPDECEPLSSNADTDCTLPPGDICVYVSEGSLPKNDLEDPKLSRLPHIDKVDRRFNALRTNRLKEPFVPTRIHFPDGKVSTGQEWCGPDKKYVRWLRSDESDDESLPHTLSDRLLVTYAGTAPMTLTLEDCNGHALLKLKSKVDRLAVVARNGANSLKADPAGPYEDLSYLIWYYPLGFWANDWPKCPEYSTVNKQAVLLRCQGESCSNPTGKADTTFWPPAVRP